jgi:hypothetical protein
MENLVARFVRLLHPFMSKKRDEFSVIGHKSNWGVAKPEKYQL